MKLAPSNPQETGNGEKKKKRKEKKTPGQEPLTESQEAQRCRVEMIVKVYEPQCSGIFWERTTPSAPPQDGKYQITEV
jgi:hypothetical protein